MGKITVQKWDAFAEDKLLDFLYQYKETSLFLLDNYQRCGPKLQQELFSGNFKILVDADQICAVFCLTKSGNLLIQSDHKKDYSDVIYKACIEEEISITGFVGGWIDGDLFWKYIKKINPEVSPKNLSKEKLYVLNLSKETGTNHDEVRFLNEKDFDNWHQLDQCYRKETNLPAHGTIDQQRQQFDARAKKEHWWGLGNTTVGCFNACVSEIAQIGSMYTKPSNRRQGQAKKLLETMISDAYNSHDIRTLILFTDQDNIPAQRLYESLGFKQIGYFGLLFWDTENTPDAGTSLSRS